MDANLGIPRKSVAFWQKRYAREFTVRLRLSASQPPWPADW